MILCGVCNGECIAHICCQYKFSFKNIIASYLPSLMPIPIHNNKTRYLICDTHKNYINQNYKK